MTKKYRLYGACGDFFFIQVLNSRANMCAVFIVENIFRIFLYAAAGILTWRTVSFSALLYPVMFAGLFAGIKSGNMMNEGAVKKLVIVMLILSGGALVLNNL